jgi:hypothetical protein
VAQLARCLQRGDSLVRDVHDAIYPEQREGAASPTQASAALEASP